jgi:hypothetical protein
MSTNLRILGSTPNHSVMQTAWSKDGSGLITETKSLKVNPGEAPPWRTGVRGKGFQGVSVQFDDDGGAEIHWSYAKAEDLVEDIVGEVEIRQFTQRLPITMHPDMGKFLAKYAEGMENGVPKWKDTIGGSGRYGFDKQGNTITDANPMAGVTDYLHFGMERRVTVAHGALSRLRMGVGQIAGKGNNWLLGGVSGRRRGGAMRVTYSYLYAPHGWNPLIYGKGEGQLEDNKKTGGDKGLSSPTPTPIPTPIPKTL